jgi:FAD/FMN-containing dehydrogenase
MHELIAALEGVPVEMNADMVRRKSRDFYWYSPILKGALDHCAAELVVRPRSEAEIVRTVAACYRQDIPITVRGGGTGNYGQCMPLRGGVVLEVDQLDQVVWLRPDRARVGTGHKIAALEEKCREMVGSELRLFPSTWQTATIGGFIAGGSSGIGAVKWGLLRDRGNVLGARVVTMEANPRILELRGQDVQKVNHGYGTNGIMTEVEIALAPARNWIDMAVALPDFPSALTFAQDICDQPGIEKRLCTVVSAPVPQTYFGRFGRKVPQGMDLVMLMISEGDVGAVDELVAGTEGARLVHAGRPGEGGVPELSSFSWNHTTLRAIKVDPAITYLQVLFSGPGRLALMAESAREFGSEVPMHLEFVHFGSHFGCFGLQLVRYSTPERLTEIMDWFEDRGCPVFNPHAYTLEDGGMKQIDAVQLAFKREADPKGLLNPGKMVAWDNPEYQAHRPVRYMYGS